jgi:hypothetical protein
VAASEARGTAYYIAADHLSYALLLHLCAEPDEARRHLEIGHSVGRSIDNELLEFVYRLFSAYIALDAKRGEQAIEDLTQAMRIGRRRGYMHFIIFPP